jgi:TonB family protein
MNKKVLIAVACTLFCAFAPGQGPNEGFVLEGEATRHLLEHRDPIYPPIAKAAHVQGSVLLHAYVDEHGSVTKVEVLDGPPMLRQAASDAVKSWTYKPFEINGQASKVRIVVSVPFSLGIPASTEKSDNAIGQSYFPKADECRAANAKGQWTQAVVLCGDLVTIAERFPDPSLRMNEVRGAHQDYGEALAFSGDLPKALEQFHRTTELAEKSLTSKDAEYGTAYYWQAFGEHASKMSIEAERDYSKAEDSYRKAIVNLPEMKQIYGRYLAHTLAYHSILAQQTGRDDQAKAMQTEALQLDPKALDGMKGNNQ